MSEREPNVEAVPQTAEASAAGLGTEPPSRSESAADGYGDLRAAIRAAFPLLGPTDVRAIIMQARIYSEWRAEDAAYEGCQ